MAADGEYHKIWHQAILIRAKLSPLEDYKTDVLSVSSSYYSLSRKGYL